MIAEYARESAMPEIGSPCPQYDTYRAMEAAGVIHSVGAFAGERMVGFILPIVIALPHYGVVTATVESFFVCAAERKKGLGLRLLDAAERLVLGLGAKALLLSAPTGGALDKVLPRRGFRHSNNVFVKALA